MRADLHVHSTASDGSSSPSGLVALALELGVDVLSITDHDSVAGVAEAAAAARGTALTLVPGVELSAVVGTRSVHVLGYFVDTRDERLLAHLFDLRAARLRRAEAIVASLVAAGIPLSMDDVLRLSCDGAVGRAHVARALVDSRVVHSTDEAFARLIGRGAPHYVPRDVRTPAEVVGIIRDAGGLAVLAHPGVSKADDIIRPLAADGLAGIEAFHGEHTPQQCERYASMARDLRLLVTGGTDYHGPAFSYKDLGSVAVPAEAVEAFLAAGAAARGADAR
ncbi:MAG: PHP domain-containing protein [Actinobacteria bacterium]|nr:MAG: PHP domain-containing protein [Actinomycetota bacterium]